MKTEDVRNLLLLKDGNAMQVEDYIEAVQGECRDIGTDPETYWQDISEEEALADFDSYKTETYGCQLV